MGMLARVACTAFVVAAAPAAFAQAERGLQAFETVRSVFQHPRCQNCHIPGDAPLQRDAGVTHQMNVKRGATGNGALAMECSVCHGKENLPATYGAHVPPGAPNWHLPAPSQKMVFNGLTPKQLCESIKDRGNTGGKDLPAMLAHNREDKLVAWGWNPGLGRVPVPVPRAAFVAAFQEWMEAGAPCPAA